MPTLSDFGRMLIGKRCDCNGQPSLAGLPIIHYDHEGGWKVDGFENRQWLYVNCPHCKYGWSLYKLGVPGRATFDEQLREEIRVHGHVTTFTRDKTAKQLEAALLEKDAASG